MQTKQSEKVADDIDLNIFRSLHRIEGMIESDQLRAPSWRRAAGYLRAARAAVRPMMNPKRRKETE